MLILQLTSELEALIGPSPDDVAPIVRRPRKRRAFTPRKQPRLEAWLFGILVVGSALAIGSVHPPVFLVFAALSLALVFLVLRSNGTPVPAPAWVLLGLGLFSAFQAIPLPISVLEHLAPESADIWTRALEPLREEPLRWASLSIDPGASVLESLKWFTYACVFFVASRLSCSYGLTWIAALLAGCGALLAVLTLAHRLSGAATVYGFYQPDFDPGPNIGPLLNRNNLCNYLNLATLSGIGVLATRETRVPRWASSMGIVVTIATVVISGSRGGVLALAVGLCAAVALLGWSKRSGLAKNRLLIGLLTAALLGGATLAMLGATNETWLELSDTKDSRLQFWQWTLPLISENLWFGVGRGAYETAFSAYRLVPNGLHTSITHPENFVVQWISEWGVIVGGGGLLVLAWLFRPRNIGLMRRSASIGLGIGVAAVLLQNCFDIGLEAPGIAIAVSVALGGLWGARRTVRETSALPTAARGPEHRWLPYWAVVLGVGLWFVTFLNGRSPVQEDRKHIQRLYDETKLQDVSATSGLRSELRAAMLRHPGESFFPLIGALIAFRVGDQEPLHWLQRALERDLHNGRAHLLLAHVLAKRGALQQALLELRLAAEADATISWVVGRTAARWTQKFDVLLRAVPVGARGIGVLESLRHEFANPTHALLRRQLLEEAVRRDAQSVRLRSNLAQELVQDLERLKGGLCRDAERKKCETEADEHVAALDRMQPNSALPALLRGRLLVLQDRLLEAEQFLARECQERELSVECVRTWVNVAFLLNDPKAIKRSVDKLGDVACATSEMCAKEFHRLGDRVAQRGEWAAAAFYYSRAAQEEPTVARWNKVAQAAASGGLKELARDAAERAARVGRSPSIADGDP